ncbi:MAG: DNA polymerase III subunit epsilon, partial [Alphaproteobacteria bacterium]|nr:DNA polymerase III subunit epsilon [Alphaproteobacteria bacterium]
NLTPTGSVFHAYYNPNRPMDAVAQGIHGLSDTFLADKPLFEDAVEDLLDFIGDAPLIAHNAMFDLGFLNHELKLCGRLAIPRERIIDTLGLARSKFPGVKHSLDALCTRFGIDRSHRVKHGALLDAELLTQVYVELLGGRQIGLALPGDKSGLEIESDPDYSGRSPVPHVANEVEYARHAAFIAQISNSLWLLDAPV